MWGGIKERQGRQRYSVLTSLSFQRPGMQKDSNRSLPHRSRMRNSEGWGQAGRERHTLSKPSSVYCTHTNRKERDGTMTVRSMCYSPISSYLIAVPRLAFSSDRETKYSEQLWNIMVSHDRRSVDYFMSHRRTWSGRCEDGHSTSSPGSRWVFPRV